MNIEQYCLVLSLESIKMDSPLQDTSSDLFRWRRVSSSYMNYPLPLTCNPLTVRAVHTEMPVCIGEVAILENRVKSSKTRIVVTFWKRPL